MYHRSFSYIDIICAFVPSYKIITPISVSFLYDSTPKHCLDCTYVNPRVIKWQK